MNWFGCESKTKNIRINKLVLINIPSQTIIIDPKIKNILFIINYPKAKLSKPFETIKIFELWINSVVTQKQSKKYKNEWLLLLFCRGR